MRKAERDKYRTLLEAKRAQLSNRVSQRQLIAVEKAPDLFDQLQLAAERELAIHDLDRWSRMRRDVELALRRLDDGTFGICLDCDQPIKSNRLNAMPWVRYCVRCQDAVDGHPSGVSNGQAA